MKSGKLSVAWVLVAALLSAAIVSNAGEKKSAAGDRPVLRIYDINELLVTVPDFPGPEMDLAAATADAGGLPVFSAAPPPPPIDEARVVDFIKSRLAPGSWGTEEISIEARNGKLIVVQTPAVHRQIEELLRAIREDGRRQLLVRALLVAVDAKTAADLRRGGKRQFDSAAAEELVKAAGAGGLLASPQVLCANGQRNHIWAGRQTAYVSGYTVSGDVPLPLVGQLLDGVVLDVRPILALDGSGATVELRLSACDGAAKRRHDVFFLPAAWTPPAEGEAGAKPGEGRPAPAAPPRAVKGAITLPDTGVLRIRNTLAIPLGRYVLAGTLPLPADWAGNQGDRTAIVLVSISDAVPRAAAPGPALDAGEALVQAVYDVRDLSCQIQNFPGPMLGMTSGRIGGGGGGVVLAPPPPLQALSAGELQELIRRSVEPASWGKDGASIAEVNGQLVVVQTPAAHRRIRQFIASIRTQCVLQLAVKGLVVAVPDELAARVRGRKSLEFTEEEAEALVKDAGEGGLLAAPEVLGFNGQRVHVYAGRQTGYISGFSATGAFSVPEVSTAALGCAFDVRPLLSPDRRAASTELRLAMTCGWRVAEEATVSEIPAAVVVNKVTVPRTEVVSIKGVPAGTVGRYVLAGTFRRSGEEAKAAPNVLVLVRVEVVGTEKAK